MCHIDLRRGVPQSGGIDPVEVVEEPGEQRGVSMPSF